MTSSLALLVALAVAPSPSVPTRAPSAWDEADRFSAEGRHADAAAAYARAWEQEGAPAILYSWAQAERLSGDCDAALTLYERFLDAGEAPPPEYDGDLLRARWADMRANAATQRDACRDTIDARTPAAPSEPAPPVAATPSVPAPISPPPDARTDDRSVPPASPWWRDPAGWSLVGVGAATLVAGGTLMGVAAWRDRTAEGRGTHDAFDDAIDRAILEQRIGIGLLAAGGAVALAGVVRLGVLARSGRRARPIALVLSGPSAGALLVGRF